MSIGTSATMHDWHTLRPLLRTSNSLRTTTLSQIPFLRISLDMSSCPHDSHSLHFLTFLIEHGTSHPLDPTIFIEYPLDPGALNSRPECICIAILRRRNWHSLTLRTYHSLEFVSHFLQTNISPNTMSTVDSVQLMTTAPVSSSSIDDLFSTLQSYQVHGKLHLTLGRWSPSHSYSAQQTIPLPHFTSISLEADARSILPILRHLPHLQSISVDIPRCDNYQIERWRYQGPPVHLPMARHLLLSVHEVLEPIDDDSIHIVDFLTSLITPSLSTMLLEWQVRRPPSNPGHLHNGLHTFLTRHLRHLHTLTFHNHIDVSLVDPDDIRTFIRGIGISPGVLQYEQVARLTFAESRHEEEGW
ncbi:hypothetical protein VNI00_016649 [Paramarasmius palmivorus]|uniref:F-box domain-containing protein n=1 Tax=Paramarasmius palmivorus TaxID=297713 RepID=A0AAW0BBT0_9AGAR